MGKTTNALIDAVNTEIKAMAAVEASVKKLWEDVESADDRKHGPQGNAAMGAKLESSGARAIEAQATQKKMAAMRPKVQAAAKQATVKLNALKSFVDTKDASTKLPWKKTSVKKAREFIKKTKVYIDGAEDRFDDILKGQAIAANALRAWAEELGQLKKEVEKEPD